jgi:flagellar basal body-associated protein FliL
LSRIEGAVTLKGGMSASPPPAEISAPDSSTAPSGRFGRVRAALGLFRVIAQDLRSPDRPTRRMSALFFLSLFAAVGVAGMALWQRRPVPAVEALKLDRDAELTDYLARQSPVSTEQPTFTRLGEFRVELRRPPAQTEVNRTLNLAEIELTAECESAEACEYLEKHRAEARDQLATSMRPLAADELLSRRGKERLRAEWVDQLNSWLPRGKVRGVWFTRLVVN